MQSFFRDKRVRFIQIETSTICNHRCVYCPVTYYPRRSVIMPLGKIESIVDDLKYFSSIEKVYLNGYDEPTLNPNLLNIINLIKDLEVKIYILSNGTYLTKSLVNSLIKSEAKIEIDINLTSINRHEFERVHQSRLFNKVMGNVKSIMRLDDLRNLKVNITKIGRNNFKDNRSFKELQDFFSTSSISVRKKFLNDRAGNLNNDYNLDLYNNTLEGCLLTNRPEEWIHISANGNVILCPEDYFESCVIGNIEDNNLSEISNSEKRELYAAWSSGTAEAPYNYICRRCVFANVEETKKLNDKKDMKYTFVE